MGRKRFSPEQIIVKLREAEVFESKGLPQLEAAKKLGIAEQTLIRWRKEYGGLRVDQAKRFKELEKENIRLKGNSCSRYRVARLMRQHGIVSKHKRKFRVTTNSVHTYPIAENLLQRRFDVFKPGQCWVSDITYIPTLEGWLYLAVTLDLFHRKVIGWFMGRWITRQLVACPIKLYHFLS